MLYTRLTEMDDYPMVYRHVLIESPTDHHGRLKPLYYAEHKELFAPWHDKIIHVVAELPAKSDPWARLGAQREAAWEGLRDAEGGDLILIADVDEIPTAAALVAPGSLRMDLCIFAVDWKMPTPQFTSVLIRRRDITLPMESIRQHQTELTEIPDAGFHLTWLGGPAGIEHKLGVFSHTELYEQIRGMADRHELYEQGRTWFDGGHARGVTVDARWPQYIFSRQCPDIWFRPV